MVTRNNDFSKINLCTLRWQARKEGDRNMRAGLIPSRALQERRIILERSLESEKENGVLPNVVVFPFAFMLSAWL